MAAQRDPESIKAWQATVGYLQRYRGEFAMDALVAKLRESGAPEDLIQAAVQTVGAEPRRRWGAIEIVAVLFFGLAWVPPFIIWPWPGWLGILWLGSGALGLVFVWISSLWTSSQKQIVSAVVVALYVLAVVTVFMFAPEPGT